MLKKTLRKKLNKSVHQKERLKELKLCDEAELREFKVKLKSNKELSKEKKLSSFFNFAQNVKWCKSLNKL